MTRNLGGQMLGWNAGGGCCGESAANDVGDLAYMSGAVDDLARRYGIDRSRVFGMGHSNGAMMTQRLVCETRVFAAGVAISGPLNLDVSTCPSARGRRGVHRLGATYTLQVVPGADHDLAHITAAIEKAEGLSIPEKCARFFGIAKP